MKKIRVRFESDPSLENIEVVIRAAKQDETVQKLTELLSSVAPATSENEESAGAPEQTPAVFSNTLQAYDDKGNLTVLNTEEIISVSVIQKVISIVTESGVFNSRQSLQSLEAELDPLLFIRISRYELINIRKVVRYDFTLPGTLRIEMESGYETWASRRCIPLIRQRLARKEGQK